MGDAELRSERAERPASERNGSWVRQLCIAGDMAESLYGPDDYFFLTHGKWQNPPMGPMTTFFNAWGLAQTLGNVDPCVKRK